MFLFPFLLLVTSALFAVIAWRDLKMGIFLVLAALPAYLIRFHIGAIPSTLLEVFLLILIIIWIFRHHGLGVYGTFLKGWRVPILLLLAASTIGVFVSPDPLAAIGVWKAFVIEPILFFFVVRSTFKDVADLEHGAMALGFGAIAVSLFGLLQWLTGIGIPIPWDIEHRVTSFYDFPNAIGLFVGPIATLSIVFATRSRHRVFFLVTAILSLLAIFAAQTEAAYVAIPASLFIVSFFHPQLRRWTIPLAAVLVIIAFAITPVRQKLLLQDYSGEVRRTQWTETIAMLKDHAIFGAGPAGYPETLEIYHKATWIEIFQYPHNIILNIWSELGLIGLAAFVLLAVQVARLTRSGQTQGSVPTLATMAAFAALLEMTIHGLVDVPYFKNDLAALTWALFAFLSLAASWSVPPAPPTIDPEPKA